MEHTGSYVLEFFKHEATSEDLDAATKATMLTRANSLTKQALANKYVEDVDAAMKATTLTRANRI